jgi:hypothetical protein
MNTYPWTLFILLSAAGLLGTAAVLPYSLALNPQALDALKARLAANPKAPPPLMIAALSSLVNSGLLCALAAFLGLLATRATGLRLPVLENLLAGQPAASLVLAFLPAALLCGLTSSLAIWVLDRWVFRPLVSPKLYQAEVHAAFWKRALACFYGGCVEEILLRLFVMSGLAWLLGLLWHEPAGLPTLGAFWVANLLAAVLFGLGHLPATARIVPLTPTLVTRAVVLNGIPGVLCGFLYMTYGLEAAMLAHFSADIVIHLIYPALESGKGSVSSQTAS